MPSDSEPEGKQPETASAPSPALAARLAELESENRRLGEQVRSLMAAENKLFVLQDHLNAQQRVYVRLAELGRTLNGTFDVTKILAAVANFVVYGFNYERCLAFAHEGRGPNGRFRVVAHEGYYDDELVARIEQATLTGREPALAGIDVEPGFVCHSRQDQREETRALGQLFDLDEYFVFALPGKGGALRGLIVAGNTKEQAEYQTGVESEGEMLVAFSNLAGQAATAINNVDSFHALERERQLLDRVVAERTRELSEALDAAHEAVRLKSEFLANVSHELRTPLNSIVNVPVALLRDYTEVTTLACSACDARFQLEGESRASEENCPDCGTRLEPRPDTVYVGDPGDHRHFLQLVAAQGAHLLRLVEDVLDFSRVDSGKLVLHSAPVDLSELLQEVRATMESSAKGNECPVRYPAFERPFVVVADRLRLKQVLINLIGNALKFTPREGEVRVNVRAVLADEARVEFSVEDTGVGIPQEQFEAIFESFRQVDGSHTRNYSGVGLGLAITRQLVKLHGGEIGVESEVGKGSTFRFWLPRDPSAVVESTVRVTPAGSSLMPEQHRKLGHGRVVVVDDEPSQLSIARRWLEREGYEVQLVGKPHAALEVVRKAQPRFVLLDVMMPELNGLAVLGQLKRDERTSQIPVVVSSAFHQNQQKIGAAGGIWLAKPWNLQRLSAGHLEKLIRDSGHGEHQSEAPRLERLSSLVSRILYVEDEDANWEVTQLSLRGKYDLVRARSAQEAFQLLATTSFDLVLLDIQLKGSGLNGIEICEVLTGRRSQDVPDFARGVRFDGPIVFVTAYAALHSREELKASGARDLISKPVDFTHLLMVLSRIMVQGAVSEIHAA